jgi:hypothetical protein
MPLAIRHSVTWRYINSRWQWSARREEAYDFIDTIRAERFCREHQLGDVDIVLIFAEGPSVAFTFARLNE